MNVGRPNTAYLWVCFKSINQSHLTDILRKGPLNTLHFEDSHLLARRRGNLRAHKLYFCYLLNVDVFFSERSCLKKKDDFSSRVKFKCRVNAKVGSCSIFSCIFAKEKFLQVTAFTYVHVQIIFFFVRVFSIDLYVITG
jgi:hypothetical protein